eukprot:2014308-Rhodomonas_salina.2
MGSPAAAMAATPDCGVAGADLRALASRGLELRGTCQWIAVSRYKLVSWYKLARSHSVTVYKRRSGKLKLALHSEWEALGSRPPGSAERCRLHSAVLE